ncbi:MAG TPA: hypothetical protein DCX67_08680 [Opitutae bacterium]|nr:hypothetical protein [Opitutae bacterium]|tara:strand:- start:278 stop:733 length:456 start_codon:yes stop_codon:yes gene_type:complete
MNLQEFKQELGDLEEVVFVLPNGSHVPPHFHVTEVGKSSKHYVDCGGTERREEMVTFQLWSADDFDHRIRPAKILEVIGVAEEALGLSDLEVEVEYQSDTIGRYGLSMDNGRFLLEPTHTDCLAKDKCGIPDSPGSLPVTPSACDPSSGCC